MSATRVAATFGATVLMASACARSPAPSRGEPSASTLPAEVTSSSRAQAPRSDSARHEKLPIPEAVARLHRRVFEPTATLAQLGKLLCLVTLHDAPLQRGSFYPLAIFANGSVATWRQTSTGSEEPFMAKLSPAELARAAELIEAIPASRGTAHEELGASSVVMGVSTRLGERVETLYFDNEQIPAPLAELVALAKQRLESENR